MKKLNTKGFSAVEVLLVVVIIGIIAGVGYFVINSQKKTNTTLDNTAKSQSDPQKSEAKENNSQAKSTTTLTTNPDLIPGDTDTRRDDGQIFITAVWKNSLEPTAVWIEYGTDPTNLNKSSEKLTKNLGEGNGTYSQGNMVAIKDSELEPGTIYYYQVAATIKGQTERSAVASFVTDK